MDIIVFLFLYLHLFELIFDKLKPGLCPMYLFSDEPLLNNNLYQAASCFVGVAWSFFNAKRYHFKWIISTCKTKRCLLSSQFYSKNYSTTRSYIPFVILFLCESSLWPIRKAYMYLYLNPSLSTPITTTGLQWSKWYLIFKTHGRKCTSLDVCALS